MVTKVGRSFIEGIKVKIQDNHPHHGVPGETFLSAINQFSRGPKAAYWQG